MPDAPVEHLWPVLRIVHHDHGLRSRGDSTPLRRLPSLLVEVADHGTWRIGHPPLPDLRAPAGRVLVIPPEYAHRLTFEGPRTSRTRFWLLSLGDMRGRDLLRDIGLPKVLGVADSRWLVAALGRCNRAATTLDQLLADQLLRINIARRILGRRRCVLPGPLDPRIHAVLRHIDDNLARPLGRARLAEVAGLSATRFHYVFSQATGQAPARYVIQRRLSLARILLSATAQSVKEIAFACGYRDAARFGSLFRRHIGQSPSTYRMQFTRLAGKRDA